MSKIKEIKQLTGLDAFSELIWSGEEADDYNLIYGWNGTGKTTLSRVLSFFEHGEVLEGFGDIDVTIVTDKGSITEDNIDNNNLELKVFNDDYISNNIFFDEAKAATIIIGRQEKEYKDEIKDIEQDIEDKQKELERTNDKLQNIDDTNKVLTECGRLVVQAFAGTDYEDSKYRGGRYDRRDVRDLIDNEEITSDTIDEHIVDDSTTIKSLWEDISMTKSIIDKPDVNFDDVENVFQSANTVLTKKISTESIERLEEDDELREWVQEGHSLHVDRDTDRCMFCKNKLSKGLLERYGRFFTQEVDRAEKEVKDGLKEAQDILKSVDELRNELPEEGALFQSLTDEYKNKKRDIIEVVDKLTYKCNELISRLGAREGKVQIDSSVQEAVNIDSDWLFDLNNLMNEINKILDKHNDRVKEGNERQELSAHRIAKHIVSQHLNDQNYFENKLERETLEARKKEIRETIDDKNSKLQQYKEDLRDESIAVGKINKIISRFVKVGTIKLRVNVNKSSEQEGEYFLVRDGNRIKRLSEGEKSIVALSYFLVSLEDEESNIEDTIVVIDDPVDSQDREYLFRTYGFLKRYMRKTKQWFLLTHNYKLFNLFRGWLIKGSRKDKSSLYWIEMSNDGGARRVILDDLHYLLKMYKSEYQYLFHKLYSYVHKKEDVNAPSVPNMARRLLEQFAYFKWSRHTKDGITNIIKNQYLSSATETEKAVGEAVIDFLHEYSHSTKFDRDVMAPVMEARVIAKNVLALIRMTDQEHYEYVMDSFPNN